MEVIFIKFQKGKIALFCYLCDSLERILLVISICNLPLFSLLEFATSKRKIVCSAEKKDFFFQNFKLFFQTTCVTPLTNCTEMNVSREETEQFINEVLAGPNNVGLNGDRGTQSIYALLDLYASALVAPPKREDYQEEVMDVSPAQNWKCLGSVPYSQEKYNFAEQCSQEDKFYFSEIISQILVTMTEEYKDVCFCLLFQMFLIFFLPFSFRSFKN